MKKHPPPISIVRARDLRRNATEAERAMKRLLKEHFSSERFRYQVPIRHYIADFASHSAKVILEIDGGQHSEEADADRNIAIEAEGYRILRFWNNEVLQNREGCVLRLRQFLDAKSPPSSSD